ncbi:MAG TPA: hypothetical protein VFW87_02020 [Pirellulales bacterium]|nr:hypothetical protein [Pirellulales bacterium]
MTARQPPLVDVCWAITSFSATLPAVDDLPAIDDVPGVDDRAAVDDPAASYAMDEQQESQQEASQHELWIGRALPLSRLATAATRRQFQAAPVVLGYDEAAGRLVLVYGRAALADANRAEEIDRHGLVLRYNSQRDELDDLLAACRELKCHCDYDERSGEPWTLPAAGGRRRVDAGQAAASPTSPRRGRRTRRTGQDEAN